MLAGAPGEARTPDLLIRSQSLYPTELRARSINCFIIRVRKFEIGLARTCRSSKFQMKSPTETEVKIRLPNSTAVASRLHAAGFAQSVPREFESNTLYDTQSRSLQNQGMILRLRQIGDRGVITWKGPDEPGPYKSRRE